MAYASLTLTSAHRGTRVCFEPDPTTRERWIVALRSGPLSATLGFWGLERTGLAAYFADLADAWRGWSGEKRWNALENDVSLRAVHDGVGHITLTVELFEYREPEWSCSAKLVLEPGMLNTIAREPGRSIDHHRRARWPGGLADEAAGVCPSADPLARVPRMLWKDMSPEDRLRMVLSDDDLDTIRRALRDVPDVNVPLRDSSRPTLLHEAAEAHALSAVRLLLEAGAHVDAKDAFGNTPLHYALFDRTEDDDVSRALRAAGADPAGATNQHPGAFDGQSAIAPYDQTGVVLRQRPDGTLEALQRPWADTYHPGSNDDWEHVFSQLPGPLMIPVGLTWIVGRIATGSAGRPVQLAAIRLFELPDPFPEPGAPEVDGEDFHRLGTLVRLPVSAIVDTVAAGTIADVETVALLFAVSHEIEHGV